MNDVDDALGEVRWAKDNMDVFGGVLLPNVPPNSEIPPLWEPGYEPLWDFCESNDVVLNVHSGSGLPDFGEHEAARAIMLIELAWFSHRAVWHLIFGGVLERHPNLKVVLTEQGTSWIPRGVDTLDWFHRRMTHGGAAEAVFFGAVAKGMSMTPSEYFQRNFWVARASFARPESALRYEVGVDRIMWGADYPHSEGSYPYTTEALRAAFAPCPPEETRMMLETTAAGVYGFDLEMLRRDRRRGRTDRCRGAGPARSVRLPERLDLQRVRPGADRQGLVVSRSEPHAPSVPSPIRSKPIRSRQRGTRPSTTRRRGPPPRW